MDKRNFYISDDYAGVNTKEDLEFYYGYERTVCVHGKDVMNHDGRERCELEWCFVVTRRGKEIWRCPKSTLVRCFGERLQREDTMEPYVMAGIALWAETFNI